MVKWSERVADSITSLAENDEDEVMVKARITRAPVAASRFGVKTQPLWVVLSQRENHDKRSGYLLLATLHRCGSPPSLSLAPFRFILPPLPQNSFKNLL